MPDKNETIYLTKEGLKELQTELESLKGPGRIAIAEKIKEASSYGDLSENAEYDEAKNEQALLEARVIELDRMIKNVQIINEKDASNKKVVTIGSHVTLANNKDKAVATYAIVGSIEADPLNGKISNESPVGKAILQKKEGETVEVITPAGKIKYTIKKIQHK